jgi:hypothetical protein
MDSVSNISGRLYLTFLFLVSLACIGIAGYKVTTHAHDSMRWNKSFGTWYLAWKNVEGAGSWVAAPETDKQALRILAGSGEKGGPWENYWKSLEDAKPHVEFELGYWGDGEHVQNLWAGIGYGLLWLLPIPVLVGLRRWMRWLLGSKGRG